MNKDITVSRSEILTKMPESVQNQQIRFFSRVDVETKLNILKEQRKQFHVLKSFHEDVDKSLLTLSSLIIAISLEASKLEKVNLNVIKLKSKKIRDNVKRQKLLIYWSLVRELKKGENLSFREISKYLKKYHRLEISYSTIQKVWVEIETYQNKEEN